MATTHQPETTPPHGNSSQWGQQRPVTIDAHGVLSTPHGDVQQPNAGATIPDLEAIGPESQTLAAWQKDVGIDPARQVRLVKLAHMRYQHPDLDTITRFLQDFGMHVVQRTEREAWFRGFGNDQYVYYVTKGDKKFLGGTFEVESLAELEKAARVPGAGPIEDLSSTAPGGGKMITLHDPEGFPVNLLFGQTPAPARDLPTKVILNDETDKPRVRQFNRFTPGPAAVHKLGHYGLCVVDFPAQLAWYTRTFNLAPTDFLWVPDGQGGRTDVAVFAHIDRGATPVDHHSFFMSTNRTKHVHHCSFEVHDYDTQQLGHQWLGKQGYTSVWGVGRHILGSQIFDYWYVVPLLSAFFMFVVDVDVLLI